MVDLDLGQPIGIVPRTRISTPPKFSEADFTASVPGARSWRIRTFSAMNWKIKRDQDEAFGGVGKIQGVTKIG